MYYDRTLSKEFAGLISPNGKLRWLFDFVKSKTELDFLIGKNNSIEWISVYRGLTRLLSIHPGKTQETIDVTADKKYKAICPDLFGEKKTSEVFIESFQKLIEIVGNEKGFERYYDNKKEGFFQSALSRAYGINSTVDSDFVIIDKESVVGYEDTKEKNSLFGVIQKPYKELQRNISQINPDRYGLNLEKKAMGNEVDFVALDREGNILLIEYKHGTNTSGIYLSPLQIGLYYEIFTSLPFNKLQESLGKMLLQKQEIGLINPLWKASPIRSIIPVLIISEYNYNSSAKDKFDEILKISQSIKGNDFLSKIKLYNYTEKDGLKNW